VEEPLLEIETHPCPLWHGELRAGEPGRAVFLDRDGVLIEDSGYPDDPERIALLPGVGEALRRLRAADYGLVVVTNQGGVALGKFTLPTLEAIHDRLVALLAEEGVVLDGIFYCPHHAKYHVAPYNVACDHRKPDPGMLRSAASMLGIDPAESWMIGDRESDVQAGHAAGCRAIRIIGGEPGEVETAAEVTAPDLLAATHALLRADALGE
jgi:D-glycero-D-manno-heptose 1,7-bisphosphate phosphatase